MRLGAIVLASAVLDPLLNVLLVFQQNSQLEFTPVTIFMKDFGY